jgi:hypothetical protein
LDSQGCRLVRWGRRNREGKGRRILSLVSDPKNGMLLMVSNRLPTPSVGRPFNDWESVVRLIWMKPKMSWPALASRKALLGSSIKYWKLSGNGPLLRSVRETRKVRLVSVCFEGGT